MTTSRDIQAKWFCPPVCGGHFEFTGDPDETELDPGQPDETAATKAQQGCGVFTFVSAHVDHHKAHNANPKRSHQVVTWKPGMLHLVHHEMPHALPEVHDDHCDDRRQRRLTLTEKGVALERRLFERQRETVMRAYREAGPAAVEGFRRVMRGLMGEDAQASLSRLEGSEAEGNRR